MRPFACRVLVTGLVALLWWLSVPGWSFADADGGSVEIGVEYVSQYVGTGSPAAQFGDRDAAALCVEGLIQIPYDPSTTWLWSWEYANSQAWETDWKAEVLGGHGLSYADDVDLVAFCGHGTAHDSRVNRPNTHDMWFDVCHDDWSATPNEMNLGVRDCEWILLFTCNLLSDYDASAPSSADVTHWAWMMNGAHLVCGFATGMTITSNGGYRFADWAKRGYTVRDAWFRYGDDTQPAALKNVTRVFGTEATFGDHLWGYGTVSADPPAYHQTTASLYKYSSRRCNDWVP